MTLLAFDYQLHLGTIKWFDFVWKTFGFATIDSSICTFHVLYNQRRVVPASERINLTWRWSVVDIFYSSMSHSMPFDKRDGTHWLTAYFDCSVILCLDDVSPLTKRF